jgi:hypothetical protein
MWRIEKITKKDWDGDKQVGQPQPPGRTVIRPQREPMPDSGMWEDLPAERQVTDVYRFAEIVWNFQQTDLPTGQKAMRGTPLPSGFEINDTTHAAILNILKMAGVIRTNGRGWELGAPPQVVKRLIQAEEW